MDLSTCKRAHALTHMFTIHLVAILITKSSIRSGPYKKCQHSVHLYLLPTLQPPVKIMFKVLLMLALLQDVYDKDETPFHHCKARYLTVHSQRDIWIIFVNNMNPNSDTTQLNWTQILCLFHRMSFMLNQYLNWQFAVISKLTSDFRKMLNLLKSYISFCVIIVGYVQYGNAIGRPSTMVLENNQYKNVVVAIHESIGEDNALVEKLKVINS